MADQVVVIDASVAIAFVRNEVATPAVVALLGRWTRRRRRLVVPSHFWIEVLNSLGKRHRMTLPEVAEALYELDQLAVETVEVDRPLLLAASALIARHDLSAYDACYLALAETLDAPLATLDRKLAAAAGARAILVEDAPPRHGLSEEAAPYGVSATSSVEQSVLPSAVVEAGRWPGFGVYIAELRARERAPGTTSERLPGRG